MSRNGVIRWRFETFVFGSLSGFSSSLKLFKTASVETFGAPGPLISDNLVKLFFRAIKIKMFSPLTMTTLGSWCVVDWNFQEAMARSAKSSKRSNFASLVRPSLKQIFTPVSGREIVPFRWFCWSSYSFLKTPINHTPRPWSGRSQRREHFKFYCTKK